MYFNKYDNPQIIRQEPNSTTWLYDSSNKLFLHKVWLASVGAFTSNALRTTVGEATNINMFLLDSGTPQLDFDPPIEMVGLLISTDSAPAYVEVSGIVSKGTSDPSA